MISWVDIFHDNSEQAGGGVESGSRGRTQVYLLYDDLSVSSGILAATLDHEHPPEKSVVGRRPGVSPEWPPQHLICRSLEKTILFWEPSFGLHYSLPYLIIRPDSDPVCDLRNLQPTGIYKTL